MYTYIYIYMFICAHIYFHDLYAHTYYFENRVNEQAQGVYDSEIARVGSLLRLAALPKPRRLEAHLMPSAQIKHVVNWTVGIKVAVVRCNCHDGSCCFRARGARVRALFTIRCAHPFQ